VKKLEGLAHRDPAHSQAFGKVGLDQMLAGGEEPEDDELLERLVNLLPQGRGLLQGLDLPFRDDPPSLV
jgi:hypothetical protein